MTSLPAIAALALLIAGQTVGAKVIDQNTSIAGMNLYYKVVLPKDYDAEKSYPAVLAFPPGSQGYADGPGDADAKLGRRGAASWIHCGDSGSAGGRPVLRGRRE